MNVLICIKQVPGTTQVEVDPVTGVLKRDGIEGKLNPYDLYVVEMAMELKEKYDAHVTAISMGPDQAKEVLLETICMGVDDGMLISDRKFAGADVLATAYTISQGIKKRSPYDLIICGKQTTDGDTAQVGAEISEFLDIPHANNVLSIEEINKNNITVRVNMETHIVTQVMPLPSLICMDSEINTPRLPSYKRKKAIIGNEIETVSLADFEDQDEKHYGLTGSSTQVERIFPPESNQSKEVLTGSSEELADKLAMLLHNKKFI